jgi:drug/metabolite transporter (DMT)-like permease
MFHALPRAGSNMANLIVQCGSVVVALTIEQLWLGTRIRAAELACLLAILSGVVFALTPRSLPQFAPRQLRRGAMLAALAALGQGSGAVLSRRAFGMADASEFPIDPGSAAFQRVLGGLLFAGVAFVVARGVQPVTGPLSPDIRRAWPWVLANALTGPVLGVTCLQWALRTTPAAIVQSIVALAPLATAPLAMAAGESLPRRRYFVGASIAVLATMTLAWLR